MTKSKEPWILNPFKLLSVGWPHVKLADYQGEILTSLSGYCWRTQKRLNQGNKITVVPAANMMGKDFIASYAALWFFVSRTPCRVVTTSIDYDQLNGVLWGEIRRWLETCKIPLSIDNNHLHLRQLNPNGTRVGLSEMVGKTAQPNKKEGLLGRHIQRGPGGLPMALFIGDEASGLQDCHVQAAETWAHQMLFIGNCYPTTNFFYRYSKAGDQDDPTIDYAKNPNAAKAVKIIRIKAEQSPNVRLGMKQKELGQEPTGLLPNGEPIIPGCMTYSEYMYRRTSPEWTEERQTIGLDAEFYEGNQIKLYPPDWIALAIEAAATLDLTNPPRRAKAMGVDPAEGGDDTVWTIVDQLGILHQTSMKTHDTYTIYEKSIALGAEYGLAPDRWFFDAGGGGKQIVQLLNRKGYAANYVPFGSTPWSPEIDERGNPIVDPKTVYKNRRAQMMGEVRQVISPYETDLKQDRINGKLVEVPSVRDKNVFGIPGKYTQLIDQMRPIPLTRDDRDVLYVLPKSKPKQGFKGLTLTELLGRSPDHLDSLALAVHGMLNPVSTFRAVFA